MFPMRSMLLVVAASTMALLPVQACRSAKEPGSMTDKIDLPPIADVLERHSAALMAIDGVVGTYEGRTDDGLACIKVMVVADSDALRARLPQSLEGYRVLVHETGEIGPVDNN
jgi:hypothetical protein